MDEQRSRLGLSRRQVLKAGTVLAAGIGMGSLLQACSGSSSGGSADDKKGDAGAGGDADKSTGWPVTKKPVKLVAYMFLGGYKEEIYRDAGAELKKAHPNIDVEFTFDPRIWDQLRPKMVAGEPPDVSYYGWGLDMAAAVDDGQVSVLDKALDAPAFDQPNVKWRDTFIPGALDLCTFDNKVFLLPQLTGAYGLWYDKKTFTDNGWDLPKSWDDFLALCGKIKQSGKMAPITYAGKYPGYWASGFLTPIIGKLAGADLLKKMANLEPGAWLDPAVVRAAEMTVEIVDKGYILDGSKALSHTESQMAWLQRKCAFVPCGNWLESEMKGNIPNDFQMRVMPTPSPAGAKLDSSSVLTFGGPDFAVFTKSQHQNEAIEYLRILLSKKFGKTYAEKLAGIPVIKGGADGANVDDAYKSVQDMLSKASATFQSVIASLYQPFGTEHDNIVGRLLEKGLTPKAYAEALEAQAEKIRKDPNMKKRKIS